MQGFRLRVIVRVNEPFVVNHLSLNVLYLNVSTWNQYFVISISISKHLQNPASLIP